MSSSSSGGVPQHDKRLRERRMKHTAKKQVQRAEVALNKYRARAAKILHAEGLSGAGTEQGQEQQQRSGYVYRILRHRETGVRVRVLDVEAPDAPASARGEAVYRYLVECETHGVKGDSFTNAKGALRAARRSDEWCQGCAGLMAATPKARNRARITGKRSRRRDDILP